MPASSEAVKQLRELLSDCDAVVVGAGAGLSVSAGFAYDGERFERYFADFGTRYGFRDMYSGGFYPYETLEEYWAYWSRYISVNRYMDPPKPVYGALRKLLSGKDYFILTTNVDHCFQKTGFDKGRLFYTQGDYGLWQCAQPCHAATYDNEETVRRMVAGQREMRVPSELIPRCPKCGKPMTMNLRCDGSFVEDDGWRAAAGRYGDFLRRHGRGRVVYLELGVGCNTPGIIKYPFWRLTSQNPDAVYVCVNRDGSAAPAELGERAVCLSVDIGEILEKLT